MQNRDVPIVHSFSITQDPNRPKRGPMVCVYQRMTGSLVKRIIVKGYDSRGACAFEFAAFNHEAAAILPLELEQIIATARAQVVATENNAVRH